MTLKKCLLLGQRRISSCPPGPDSKQWYFDIGFLWNHRMVLAFNHTFTFVRNLRVYDPSHYWFNSIEYAWYAFVIEKLVLQRWKQKTAMAAADDPSVYQVKCPRCPRCPWKRSLWTWWLSGGRCCWTGCCWSWCCGSRCWWGSRWWSADNAVELFCLHLMRMLKLMMIVQTHHFIWWGKSYADDFM